ncbi:Protein of unknown function [Formivibrio citricus]|uniref:DUF3617 family protein n=1 Tax=Formivibrio citricus TaxID=83765 RepID=A0A1I4WHG6_9NEIS|nr:DUF3617 family protein [Formivibrio citricus]SFN12710.1 Protein of unknown function [Formivibrio citricus]
MKAYLVAALIAVPAIALAADKPDMTEGLWEITSKVNMPGMPMQMPAHTMQHCFTKEDIAKGDKTVPQNQQSDQKCDMVERRMTGNKLNYKMVCSGKNKMTMTGEVIYSRTSYRGTSQMDMVQNGQPMRMTTEYSAKRLGNCKK